MRSLVVLLLLAMPLAVASHSASPCAHEVTTIDAGVQTLYVVRDTSSTDMWIYVESNGHAGLQRGGYYEDPALIPTSDPQCWDLDVATGEQIADPDFLIY